MLQPHIKKIKQLLSASADDGGGETEAECQQLPSSLVLLFDAISHIFKQNNVNYLSEKEEEECKCSTKQIPLALIVQKIFALQKSLISLNSYRQDDIKQAIDSMKIEIVENHNE